MPIATKEPEYCSPYFNKLVDDNRYEIYKSLLIEDLSFFAISSKSAMRDVRKNIALELMPHLAAFALPVSPDQKEKARLSVLRLLKLYPDLLFVERQVNDLVGRTIVGSIYKIFLGAGDIAALKEVREKIIPRIENGAAIADKQYKEQFPHHANKNLTAERRLYDERNIAQVAEIKADLKEIAAAFTEDPCTGNKATKQRTIEAINKLRLHLAPKKGEVIHTGLHYPPVIMKMIYDVYYQRFLWTEAQEIAYSKLVIGLGEAFTTAVDAQYYKNGLNNLDKNNGPDRTVSYLTDDSVTVDLGKSKCVDVYDGSDRTNDMVPINSSALKGDLFMADFVKEKNQHLNAPESISISRP